MNVFDEIDKANSALLKIRGFLSRPSGIDYLKKNVDMFAAAMDKIIELRSMNTYFDLVAKASNMLDFDLGRYKLSDDEWSYYLQYMPSYSQAIGQLVGNNYNLNNCIVNATIRWETRTDPYIDLYLASKLLEHNDQGNWVNYVSNRRHDKCSAITALCSLGSLTNQVDDSILETTHSFLSIADLQLNDLNLWSQYISTPQIDRIYEVLYKDGHSDLVKKLIAREPRHPRDAVYSRLLSLSENYGYEPSQLFTNELIDSTAFCVDGHFMTILCHYFTTTNNVDSAQFFNGLNNKDKFILAARGICTMVCKDNIKLNEERLEQFFDNFVRNYKSIEKLDKDIAKFDLPMKEQIQKCRAYKRLKISSDLEY